MFATLLNQSFRRLLAASLLVACLVSSGLSAATMHMVIVADVLDWNIGQSVRLDVRKAQENGQRIADLSGMYFKKHVFRYSDFDAQAVINGIEGLNVDEDDTVFFYYSGHGFRTSQNHQDYPALFFGFEGESLDVADLVEAIEAKNPRLTLVIADSCNKVLSVYDAPPMLRAIDFSTSRWWLWGTVDPVIGKLFRESRGTIVCIGAIPGDFSYCNDQIGGFYSDTFWKLLFSAVEKKQDTSWEELLDEVDTLVRNRYEQYPMHFIYR